MPEGISVAELILELQHAAEPSRRLDSAIAAAIGYKLNVSYIDEGGKKVKNVVWLNANLGRLRKIPFYTLSIDDAKALCEKLIPRCVAGFSWEPGRFSAQVNGGVIFTGSSPAIALCIAGLATWHVGYTVQEGTS